MKNHARVWIDQVQNPLITERPLLRGVGVPAKDESRRAVRLSLEDKTLAQLRLRSTLRRLIECQTHQRAGRDDETLLGGEPGSRRTRVTR
jgi:hypothetical protein